MTRFEVIVATIGKAHGLRGEVALNLRTDQPAERLLAGTVFDVAPGNPRGTGAAAGPLPRQLTLASTRTQQDRWYARFEEIPDRTTAESLRGAELSLELDAEQESEEDPDAWYASQLEGLPVRHVDGRELGVVTGLQHYPAQDLLLVRTPDGRRVQLPLVEQLVPEIDLERGEILADPPGGLFEDLPDEDDAADQAPSSDAARAAGEER